VQISYSASGGPAYKNDVISFNWGPRYVEPQPGVPNEWDAPFFFEDRQNVFYVTTSEGYVWFSGSTGFGILSTTLQGSITELPSLVLQQEPHPLNKGDPILAAGDRGQTAPFVVQAALLQAPTIRAALGSGLAVSYQGRQIGMTQSSSIVLNGTAMRNGSG
jgi:hypothetical protein